MRKEKYLKKSRMEQKKSRMDQKELGQENRGKEKKELGQENRGKEKKEEGTQQKVSKGERYPDERSRPYLGRKIRLRICLQFTVQ